jgi:hypothetical protein
MVQSNMVFQKFFSQFIKMLHLKNVAYNAYKTYYKILNLATVNKNGHRRTNEMIHTHSS